METKKITFDMSKEEQERILAEMAKKAIGKAHALGLPTTHGDNKGIYKLYPDGRREYIDLYEKKEDA